jgi:hypothetical protein
MPMAMALRQVVVVAVLGCFYGCANAPGAATVQVLDPHTGVTVATLEAPIELVQSGALPHRRRANFAYMGPVEWNRMGDISYALWIHIAPGDDEQVDDLRAPAAVMLILAEGAVALTAIDPGWGGQAYLPVVPWGQTGYFAISAATLNRLGNSKYLALDLRTAGASTIRLLPTHEPFSTLKKYAEGRLSNGY